MATILLSAAGAAIGGSIGGGVLGLSSAVIGRAVGATIGRAIDARIMGAGSEVVETGRLDRLRIMGASEGGAVPRVFGRMRVPGNVIWASRYRETVTETQASGGKGAPSGPTTRSYSYSVSLAIALCEGEISRVGRIWADGALLPKSELGLTVYPGSELQQPDPVISAVEGSENVPAYRGLAYVVIEDLELSRFGNRIPQFAFEVIRPAQPDASLDGPQAPETIQAVALMPGSGEYALATSEIYRTDGSGMQRAANVNTIDGLADFRGSLAALSGELPNCRAVSLIVSWFGDDLRAGQCQVRPKVESLTGGGPRLGSQPVAQGGSPLWSGTADDAFPWTVSGQSRADAQAVARIDGRPVYGGTPSDASVVEAIAELKASNQAVMFYPFLLMEQLEGNGLPDPWSDADDQPALPWRGRITTEQAPGREGTTDLTAAARAEVAAFFGTAQIGDFAVSGQSVRYTGSEFGGYRHFILHYAHLCAAAGGVDSFCIGTEMRSLTQIRDETGGFPAVDAFRELASDVRAILGPDCKIGYAADWSEYFGYQPQDGSGDLRFHLDPLWADDEIDFIGIDNYVPISDWRDGEDHLDAAAGTIYNLDYLRDNIEGGEGYDWYYRDPEERALQIRTPIEDGAYGEPWVYRYKDMRNWWLNLHHERVGGVRAALPTAWVPQSKPIWFTELGCAAIDKGTNQPNKFLDPKSSESAIPHFSNGRRDDYLQAQYLRAFSGYYADPAHNPISVEYGGAMVDMSRAFIWAWDARPWPDFPNNLDVWSDGGNYATGHWLTGRSATPALAHVVSELCERAGLARYDVSQLHGVVRGFGLGDVETPRASLQTLMTVHSFDAIEAGGVIRFLHRKYAQMRVLDPDALVWEEGGSIIEQARAPQAEVLGQVALGFVEAGGGFESTMAEARFPDDLVQDRSQNDLPLALTGAEAQAVAERWLSEARVARDRLTLTLPPSRADVTPGVLVSLGEDATLYRVDRVETGLARKLDAVRVEKQIYEPSEMAVSDAVVSSYVAPVPVTAQFLDLPLLTGDEVPYAPAIAAISDPWSQGVAVYSAGQDAGYSLNTALEQPATLGILQTVLTRGAPDIWQRDAGFEVSLSRGSLSSASPEAVQNGANAVAIGDGSIGRWEIVQFAEAELIAPDRYRLTHLLRGQAGTDGLIPDFWPVGSRFVLLDAGVQQLQMAPNQRALARHYRVGPIGLPVDHPSFRHYVEIAEGIGLRPYAPAHLRAEPEGANLWLRWIRRTRIDGDSWSGVDVPLGEESERYLLRFRKAGAVLREIELSVPQYLYSAAQRAQDGPVEIEVAQISQQFGPGLFARMDIDG